MVCLYGWNISWKKITLTSSDIRECVGDYTYEKQWDGVTYSCRNFNSSLNCRQSSHPLYADYNHT